MRRLKFQGLFWAVVCALLCFSSHSIWASQQRGSDPAAVEQVRQAVIAELEANRTDKSVWTYRESDFMPDKKGVYTTIETPQGTLRRLIELNGRPLSPQAAGIEMHRIDNYIHDSAAQARARRNAAHDDAQAEELLKMLPEAFLWTKASENGDSDTLNFRPNPGFDPPDMQSRVMGIMEGQMVISKEGHRIVTLRGKLSDDVRIGWGILGKLDRGGTFDVERRMVGEHHWQITETHVHIGGHALFFHNIGQQEDDVKTEWKPSTAQTLEQAAQQLANGQ
ncbi:MAG TPA: hypothetical protein VGU25_12560 [Acidobacteriaceae bacterium]|nr:hypothetical protein [Acidobacteriaceae bacterium]